MMRHLFFVAAIAFSATAAAPASATDDDPRKVQAEPALRQGQRLYSQGKFEEALAKLREAYGIYPSPNVLSLIAMTEQALGRHLDAIGHFRDALRNPTLHPDNAALARKGIAELEPRLGRIDVHGPKGLTITLGKNELSLPLKEPLDVEPGSISAEGHLGDAPWHGQVTASPGKLTALEMKPDAQPVSAAAKSDSASAQRPFTPPPDVPQGRHWGTGQYVGVGVAGVGLAAVIAGVGFTVAKNKSETNVTDLEAVTNNGSACSNGANSRACADLTTQRDERDRYQGLATGLLIGGAVVVVAGVVTFLVSPRAYDIASNANQKPRRVRPLMGGLELQFD